MITLIAENDDQEEIDIEGPLEGVVFSDEDTPGIQVTPCADAPARATTPRAPQTAPSGHDKAAARTTRSVSRTKLQPNTGGTANTMAPTRDTEDIALFFEARLDELGETRRFCSECS